MAYLFQITEPAAPLGWVYTYAAGTTTPIDSYTTQSGASTHQNPAQLDAEGRIDIWLDPRAYKLVVKTEDLGTTVRTSDNVVASSAAAFQVAEQVFTATDGQTVFTLTAFDYVPGNASIQVTMNGITLRRSSDYAETSGTVFTLTSGAAAGDEIVARAAEDLGANLANNASTVVYTPAGTGAQATNVQAQLRKTVYVTDFGATGDGATDDSTEIQAAITYVASVGGGTIVFPPGDYGIGATVVMRDNVRLLGMGRGVSTCSALAALDITDPMFEGESGDTGFEVWADTNYTIENMTFDGDARAYPAWDVNTDPPTYDGLTAANSRGQMIKFVAVDGVRVVGCEFKNHRSNGALNIQGCINVVIDGNDWHDNGKVDDISPCLYISDTFTNITGSANVTVCNNHFHDCDRIGINFYADGGGAIVNNTFTDMGEGAINLGQGSQRVVVSGNKIRNVIVTDIVGMGIEINQKNAPDGAIVITGNVFENCGTCGVASNGQNQLIVADNIFLDCGAAATYPAVVGPYMYARGYAANDPMPDEKRSAIRLGTGDLYQSHNTIISSNVIASDGATTQYALAFIATGTPNYLHERIRFAGNTIEGMAAGHVTPDNSNYAGADNYIEAEQAITSSTTPDLNCLAGNVVTFTATAASAWSQPVVLPPAGSRITITITQDGTGGWAITWHADFIFPTAWTNTGNTAGKKSTIVLVSDGTKLVAQGANSWY